jgi:predicted choloylglycine hydrolase
MPERVALSGRIPCMSFVALLAAFSFSFSESVVAGTESDFMIARHLEISGTNEQIGRKLAEIARDRHHVEPAMGDEAKVKARLAWLEKAWPEQYTRAMGVAAAFDRKPGEAGFDPASLNYDLDLEPGCSVAYYPGKSVTTGHAMLSRNYDFHTTTFAEMVGAPVPKGARAMTADPYVISMHPSLGYAALYLCSYDLLGAAIDGVNEEGLAVALLADDSAESTPTSPVGLTELRLPRFVLDRCATAAEARKALADIPFGYVQVPCHYMICDASGDSFVWEITPDLKQRFVVDGGGKPQVVTNHLLAQFPDHKAPAGNSGDRFARLEKEIADRHSRVTPDDVQAINQCVAVPKMGANHATLWHSVYDLQDRSLSISFFLGRDAQGAERRSPYLKFKL